MKRQILILLLIALFSPLGAQTFADFLTRVNNTDPAQRGPIVDSLINAVPAFPYTEQDTLCHFIYRGSGNQVNIPGDANGWNPARDAMTKIAGTNFFYRTAIYENNARLDYKFVIDGSNWILDPLNPNTISGGFGPNSELNMPAYADPPELVFDPLIPHGTINDTSFFSSNLNNSRTIRVYLPPGYAGSSDRYPMVLFHDGLEYLSLGEMRNVLDYLIANELAGPLIAVFVPPVNRTEEYAGSLQDEFTLFIVDEVISWIDGRYRTRATAESRATLGASNGGNISLWLGMTHPDVFGHVAAQSSYIQPNIIDGFTSGPLLPLEIYMDLGNYDIPVLIPLVRSFIPILQNRGYNYQYAEYPEGHSWGFWRSHIDDALEMFFPAQPTGISLPAGPRQGFQLEQNYPNPFNPSTTIPFRLEAAAQVHITVFDTAGRQVAELLNKQMPAGEHRVVWDAAEAGEALPSGTYFYRLTLDRQPATARPMILLR